MPRLRDKPAWLAHIIASYAAYVPVLFYQLYHAPVYPTAQELLVYAFLAMASPVLVPFSFLAQALFVYRWWSYWTWVEPVFPYTYVVAFACVYFPFRRHEVRKQFALLGHCPGCGYDLRATPDLCPECGSVTSPAPPQGDPAEDFFTRRPSEGRI